MDPGRCASQQLQWILIHVLSLDSDNESIKKRFVPLRPLLAADNFALLKRTIVECRESTQSCTQIIDQLLQRIKALLQAKNIENRLVGIDLARMTFKSEPTLVFPQLSAWCQILIGVLNQQGKTSSHEDVELKTGVIGLLVDLLLATVNRNELYRDVASVFAPKLITSLLSMYTEPLMLIPTLDALQKLALRVPSLVKPFTEKIKKICIEQLFSDVANEATAVKKSQNLLLELCNCVGKNGCDEQLSALLKQMLGTLGHDMNTLLACVQEEFSTDFQYELFAEAKTFSADFVEAFPALLARIELIMRMLTRTLQFSFVCPVSLPIEDMFGILRRIASLDDFMRLRQTHSREEFVFLQLFTPQLHSLAIQMMQTLLNVLGPHGRRYRIRIISFVMQEWAFSRQRISIRLQLFGLMRLATKLLKEAFVAPIAETILPELIELVRFEMVANQTSIQNLVEQSNSNKHKNLKVLNQIISGENQQLAPLAARKAALKAILFFLTSAPLAVSLKYRHQIDVILLQGIISSQATFVSPHHRASNPEETITPDIRYLMYECLLYSALSHANLHSTTLSIMIKTFAAGLQDEDINICGLARLGTQYFDLLVHPRAPILTKRKILETEWKNQEESMQEDDQNDEAMPAESSILHGEKSVQTEQVRSKCAHMQTNDGRVSVNASMQTIEILSGEIFSEPPVKRVKMEMQAESAPVSVDPVQEEPESVNQLEATEQPVFSDLEDIDINDADPDEE